MWNLLSLLGYKIPLITSIIFRGDYRYGLELRHYEALIGPRSSYDLRAAMPAPENAMTISPDTYNKQ